MINAVIAIYLAQLFTAVLAVMAVGCAFEQPGVGRKSIAGAIVAWTRGPRGPKGG